MRPQIRFKEFTDDWEEKKLGEIATIVGGGTPSTNVEEYWDGDIQWFTPSEIKNKYIDTSRRKITTLGLQKSSAKLLPRYSILLTTRATLGEMSILKKEASTNQGFQSIIVNENNNYEFIYYLQPLIKKQCYKKAAGSTFLEVSKREIERIVVKIPSLPEQEKIGKFFSLLDQRIEKQERKVALLEEEKKGWMQKLFNQEIRFKDENGNDYPDWEEKKLGEVLKERKKYDEDNQYELVSFTVESGVTPKTDRYNREFLVKDDSKKYKITYFNDIVYNPANLKFGAISLNKYGSAKFSPIYVTFEVNDALAEYLGNYLKRPEFINYALRYQEGTVYERQAVKPKDLLSLLISIPSLPEQEKIANFLLAQDKLIEKEKEKLNLMKQEKQGFMQRMFV